MRLLRVTPGDPSASLLHRSRCCFVVLRIQTAILKLADVLACKEHQHDATESKTDAPAALPNKRATCRVASDRLSSARDSTASDNRSIKGSDHIKRSQSTNPAFAQTCGRFEADRWSKKTASRRPVRRQAALPRRLKCPKSHASLPPTSCPFPKPLQAPKAR
jgi:hypothetical protein